MGSHGWERRRTCSRDGLLVRSPDTPSGAGCGDAAVLRADRPPALVVARHATPSPGARRGLQGLPPPAAGRHRRRRRLHGAAAPRRGGAHLGRGDSPGRVQRPVHGRRGGGADRGPVAGPGVHEVVGDNPGRCDRADQWGDARGDQRGRDESLLGFRRARGLPAAARGRIRKRWKRRRWHLRQLDLRGGRGLGRAPRCGVVRAVRVRHARRGRSRGGHRPPRVPARRPVGRRDDDRRAGGPPGGVLRRQPLLPVLAEPLRAGRGSRGRRLRPAAQLRSEPAVVAAGDHRWPGPAGPAPAHPMVEPSGRGRPGGCPGPRGRPMPAAQPRVVSCRLGPLRPGRAADG